MIVTSEFVSNHPEASSRLESRLADYLKWLTPEQQVELETAETVLSLVYSRFGWRLEVAFKLELGMPVLCVFDAASIGLHVVDDELIYLEDRS